MERDVHRAMDGSSVGPPDTHPPDERALVRRVQHDADMDAFATLYRSYVRRIHAFASRRCGSAALADDVTSATFERALRSIDSFRWRGAGFGPWLFRIAANELATHYRVERRRATDRAQSAMSVFASDDGATVEDSVLSERDTLVLRAALDSLRPRYQRAIVLRYLSGLTNEEAATAMGISRPLMAVTLHRALAALRRSLGASAPPAEAPEVVT